MTVKQLKEFLSTVKDDNKPIKLVLNHIIYNSGFYWKEIGGRGYADFCLENDKEVIIYD